MSTEKIFTITGLSGIETVTATQADGASTWTLSADSLTLPEGKTISDYFSFDGTTFTVKQAAIDAGLTAVTGPDTTIQLAVEQGVKVKDNNLTETNEPKEISGWAAAGGGFTYYSGKLGYAKGKTDGRTKRNQLTITNTLQDKFTIAGTDVTADNVSTYFEPNALSDKAYTVTPTDTFVSTFSGTATITLTPAENISAAWSYKTSPEVTLSETGYATYDLSAYGAINGTTLTLHAAQTGAFTISGIKENLQNLSEVATVTVEGNIINITLDGSALDGKEVYISNAPAGYEAAFTLSGGTYDKYTQDESSVTGTASGFTFTAGGETDGYKISSDRSKILYNAEGAGGETFEIKGLGKNLSDYTLNVDDSGVITATKDSETVTVGTVKKDGTQFSIALGRSVVPTNGTISVTSSDNVSFVLTGLAESANKEATLTTQSESTPP